MPLAELNRIAVVTNAPPTAISQPVRESERLKRLETLQKKEQ